MEIERKFLVKTVPGDLSQYPCRLIEQGYLCTDPVVRVRRDNDDYYLTYKGKGFLAREEANLSLTKDGYEHLLKKADGNIITKRRYLIPVPESTLTIELDLFDPPFAPLILAEVEFPSVEEAKKFTPPDWFGRDVTEEKEYTNSSLSRRSF